MTVTPRSGLSGSFFGVSTFGILSLASSLVACLPAPPPGVPPVAAGPPAPSSTPAAPPTAVVATAPKEKLPTLHPCVPDFIQKELHECGPGHEPAEYSAVANAMAAMTAAGPTGPRPKESKPVPRELSPLEEKAAATARAFLCSAAKGTVVDDERATTAFDLGRLYLAANHFEEATVFLRDVSALDPQTHAEVEYAARFLLDAARPLGEARPECVAFVTALTVALETHVCQGPGADQRAETCAAITVKKN